MWPPRFGQAEMFPFNWPCNLQQLGWIKGEGVGGWGRSPCDAPAGSGHLERGASTDRFRSCRGGRAGRGERAGARLCGWRPALLMKEVLPLPLSHRGDRPIKGGEGGVGKE